MADRENVIKRLESVSYYFKSLLAVGWQGDADIYREHKETVRMAIALLKEQEPAHIQRREFAHMWFWCCGSCGVAITEGDKFCRMCGKAVKWDDRY